MVIAINYIPLQDSLKEFHNGDKWVYSVFTVPIEQLRVQTPIWYAKMKEKGKNTVVILAAHADQHGNLPQETREAYAKHNPDMVYCCHPAEARRANPDWPIQGWHSKEVIYYRNEGVIRLQEK